jgi:RNA polymerase sigma factor (sigma-70 family)
MKANRSAGLQRVSVAACAAAVAASVSLAAAPASAGPQVLDKVQRYCAVSWRHAGIHPQDWSDCTQDAIAQLLERVPQDRLDAALGDADSPERRELKRAIWRTAQRWRRAPRFLPFDPAVNQDPRDDEAYCDLSDWLNDALETLTARQRRILTLWSQGRSIDEIAHDLGVPAARASDEKYKALRKLRERWTTAELTS